MADDKLTSANSSDKKKFPVLSVERVKRR